MIFFPLELGFVFLIVFEHKIKSASCGKKQVQLKHRRLTLCQDDSNILKIFRDVIKDVLEQMLLEERKIYLE